MAALEWGWSTLEPQLHALLELCGTGFVDPSGIAILKSLDRSELSHGLSGYLGDLGQAVLVSCFFRVGDMEVWNPSNRVARLFIAEINAVAGVFGVASGVGVVVDDECEIDGKEFSAFINLLVRECESTNNRALRVLVEGVATTGLVILERSDFAYLEMPSEVENAWMERVEEISSGMPWGE